MIEVVVSFISGIIIKWLYDLTTNIKLSKTTLVKRIDSYFTKVDKNNDDEISLLELIKFIKKG